MLAIPTCFETALAGERPNILFLAIDDQNDWVGPLGGHALAQTPHMDQLAKRGMVFTNAHCQAPLCNPSRTSLMLGLRPTSTGIYGLAPWFRTVDHLRDYRTLPQTLHRHGYRTFAAGKIFHGEMGRTGSDEPEFDVWGPSSTIGATPQHKLIPPTPDGNHPLMDWGVFPHRDEEKGDYQIASWAIETLHTMPAEQPFFLAAGFFLPHVPCYVTKRWIDLYPDDDSVLPMVLENDRSDTPPFSWYLHWRLPEPRLDWLTENNQWRNLVRSYLASTSFVDAQIGRVLAALENSPFAANTIVVLWSDHGWHLGEKSITGKNTLWERSTRVPLIFVGPGIQPNSRCSEPVELLDIYPTLLTMCGLPSKPHLEGHSLAPQLANPEASRAWPAITSHNKGNHAIRTRDWRYIRYANGSEELYDEKSDPREELNLVGQPKYADTIQELRQYLPKVDRDPAPGSAHRVLTYDPTTKQAIWEGTVIEDRP